MRGTRAGRPDQARPERDDPRPLRGADVRELPLHQLPSALDALFAAEVDDARHRTERDHEYEGSQRRHADQQPLKREVPHPKTRIAQGCRESGQVSWV